MSTIKEKRVAVTGIGPLTSIGYGRETVWKNILAGKVSITKEDFEINSEVAESFHVHRIKNFSMERFKIEHDLITQLNQGKKDNPSIDLAFFVTAGKLALEDSKIFYDDDLDDLSLIVSHENPGMGEFYSSILKDSFSILEQLNRTLTEKQYVEEMYGRLSNKAYDLQTFMFLFYIAKFLKVHGYTQFINNACASGLYAIESASQIIKSGMSSSVLIIAGDHPDIFKYLWFKKIGLYSDDGKIRPFADNSTGFVFGDGAIGIVMEELDHALKRKAPIYGEYMGGGFTQDGWKVSFPAVTAGYYKKALINALLNSKIIKDDVDLIVPHGVGNNITDRFEAKVISSVFGEHTDRPYITALKPYFGHNLGGSALLETAILLLAMSNNVIPPTLNCEKIAPRIKINLVTNKIETDINVAVKMACGFAGYNAVSVFRKVL